MAEIIINGKAFHYDEENLVQGVGEPLTEESVRKTLDLAQKLFKQKNLKFFLFWGTLLGAVREHGLIKGDEDVDVVFEGSESDLISIIPYLKDNGLHLIRVMEDHVYSFRTNENCYIDFYIKRPLKGTIWSFYCCWLNGYIMPKRIFKSFVEMEFLGGSYLAPKRYEESLEVMYGRSWRTPVKGHTFNSNDKYYLMSVSIKRFLLKVIRNIKIAK